MSRAVTRCFCQLAAGVALVAAMATVAAAQPAPSTAATADHFLPRADFSFQWARLIARDARFDWHADVSFDIDVVDYRRGRLNFAGGYEAVLGRERRSYDLNQGTYRFEVGASQFAGSTELIALLSHVSRHLTDRDNHPTISWNTAGVRARRRFPIGRSTVDATLDLVRAMQQAYVDYLWMSDLRLAFRRPVTERLELIATGSGGVIGVNHTVRAERVCGGRIEGGLRINGRAAALEVFGGYERRMDAFPTDRFRVRWSTVGFRLVTR